MILMIGATGELGARVVRELRSTGKKVRVLVRPGTVADDLFGDGVDLWRGDLTDPDSLAGICEGIDVVVATANTIVPRRGERTSARALNRGYLGLAETAEQAGVRRFVFVSVPRELFGRGAAEFDAKAEVEEYLRVRRFELCVVRPSLFMESWLPAIGSRLATAGAERSTLDRGFWLSRFAGAVLHRTVDRFGIAQHPGLRGRARHSFVHVADVAEVVARLAVDQAPVPQDFPVGGPQALTWSEVGRAHGAVLGRKLRTVRVPSAPFSVLAALLRPFSPTAANLLQVQSLVGRHSTAVDARAASELLGRPMTSVAALLEARATAGTGGRSHW